MKLSQLYRGKSALLKGNFLLLTISWMFMFFAQPIPATYASLYYLNLGADAFLLKVSEPAVKGSLKAEPYGCEKEY